MYVNVNKPTQKKDGMVRFLTWSIYYGWHGNSIELFAKKQLETPLRFWMLLLFHVTWPRARGASSKSSPSDLGSWHICMSHFLLSWFKLRLGSEKCITIYKFTICLDPKYLYTAKFSHQFAHQQLLPRFECRSIWPWGSCKWHSP